MARHTTSVWCLRRPGWLMMAALLAFPWAAVAQSATTPPAAKVGAHLVGKLEGYEIVRDPARIPKRFNEAPALADQVKAGKLPPVERRLPAEPLVVKPVHEVGRYGGTWRRAFTGPGDGENGNRLMAVDKFLFWDHTGTRISPSVAREWKVSDDGKTVTLSLRKGMRWSDGQPFTTADVVFWYEDLYLDKELVPTPLPEFAVGGKPGRVEKIDDLTFAFKFDVPYYIFEAILAADNQVGRGQATGQGSGRFFGGYAPRHYLKQFLPKYASMDELEREAKREGFDNWKSRLRAKIDWQRNPDLPVLAPWKTVTPITGRTWTLERNPYYWEVDTAGNQLPYIDRVVMTQAENLEVVNLRALAGEIDFQARHIDIQKLPVYLENQGRGGYKVYLDPGVYGADTALHVNLAYDADPEIARWLASRDFRRALALGIDRDQINEVFFLGLGTPGSPVVTELSPENPGAEYRKRWSTHDPKRANELLDQLGLTKRDAEGFRLRSDGKGRLRIPLETVAAAFLPWTKHAEMIVQQWRQIGIQGDVKEVERSLYTTRLDNSEAPITLWSNGGTELLYLYPSLALPLAAQAPMGIPFYRWFASGGKEGRKPADAQLLNAIQLFTSGLVQKEAERNKTAQEIWKILVEEQWSIGVVGLSPAFLGVRIASTRLGNVPARQVNAQHMRTPSGARPTTLFFKP
jgi:peptide/nickel transport system substrate-binding protein